MKKFIIAFALVLCLPCISFAHSGGTDSSGGHNSPTGYHYHHGYSAHSHTDGICPYDFDDATEYHPSSTYSAASKPKDSNIAEPEEIGLISSAWSKISAAIEIVAPPFFVAFGAWFFANIFFGILSIFSPFNWLENPIKKSTEIWSTIVCTLIMLPFMLIGQIFLMPERFRKIFRK